MLKMLKPILQSKLTMTSQEQVHKKKGQKLTELFFQVSVLLTTATWAHSKEPPFN
uniref:Uncharacterized protein n=1 Tax=Rhizophora mucronata TaxID=61149 RepID=A0A2P2QR16_RHIMU